MRILIPSLCLVAALLSGIPATAQQPAPEIRRSPDAQHFVTWFDHDLGTPLGVKRSIILGSVADHDGTIFSFAGTGRSTDAAWNHASTRCVIKNEVDWERTVVWVVFKDASGQWSERKLDVMAPVHALYLRAIGGRDHPGFRVHLDKIEWLSDTQARFLVWANLNDPTLPSAGRYWVTIDTESPNAAPTITRIPEG